MNEANSNENLNENVEAVADTNSYEETQRTQENENSTNAISEVAQTIDYQKKFSESSKEALRLHEENKKLREELELKDTPQYEDNTENLYPGFNDLDEESKSNLLNYTETVTNKAAEKLKKDPAYAFALRQYSETKFNNALDKVVQKYPDLIQDKDTFRSKYYKPSIVPDNIEEILDTLAKTYLFDKAKEIGAREAEEKLNRFDSERVTAGKKESTVTRSLDDWARMARENPTKFAALADQYKSDLESGKI
jgi:hypothetical protein